MQAIILAAGMGRRLKELTSNNTKCMLSINGSSLIERMLNALDTQDLKRIIIVTGYQAENLMSYVDSLRISTPIEYIENREYERTNNIYSLYLASEQLAEDDTLLLESDLIFEPAMIDDLVRNPFPNLVLAAKYQSWMDGTVVTLDDEDNITSFIDKKHFSYSDIDSYYKTVNIYKFSQEFSKNQYIPFLKAYSTALGNNQYYEQVLKVIALLDNPNLKGLVTGRKWYEIDDAQDKDIAEALFEPDPMRKYDMVCRRYGGFWRFPGLLDYCYLVNPYFPPRKMEEEMKAGFTDLLTQYPSGQAVNSLVAGKTFGVHQDMIAVGNGAAELISSLTRIAGQDAVFGLCLPSFEEYSNRIDDSRRIPFIAKAPDFRYSADDLISFFNDKHIDYLILINPDNPSGSFMDEDEVLHLLEWTETRSIRLILDESFSDFAEESFTAIDQQILEKHPSLIVIKSISKSYGIPGARLGLIASGDTGLIQRMKKDISQAERRTPPFLQRTAINTCTPADKIGCELYNAGSPAG